MSKNSLPQISPLRPLFPTKNHPTFHGFLWMLLACKTKRHCFHDYLKQGMRNCGVPRMVPGHPHRLGDLLRKKFGNADYFCQITLLGHAHLKLSSAHAGLKYYYKIDIFNEIIFSLCSDVFRTSLLEFFPQKTVILF